MALVADASWDPGSEGGRGRVRPAGGSEPPTVTSEDLLGGGKELVILHGQDRYRLRVTSQGKLILTK